MTLGEREQDHRHRMQSRALWFNGIGSVGGMLFAGAIGLTAVGGGVYAMISGVVTDFAGAGVALGGLASLAGVYIYGRKSGGPGK